TLLVICFSTLLNAQSMQADHPQVDTLCVADDENFTRLFDSAALAIAVFGFFLLPMFLPVVSRFANNWKWADPAARWMRLLWVPLLMFALLFLPPQLARVGAVFRPIGLSVFHYVGNVRLEYLDCDLHAFQRDYGFLFFTSWSPGSDLMIRYWLEQAAVFVLY